MLNRYYALIYNYAIGAENVPIDVGTFCAHSNYNFTEADGANR